MADVWENWVGLLVLKKGEEGKKKNGSFRGSYDQIILGAHYLRDAFIKAHTLSWKFAKYLVFK